LLLLFKDILDKGRLGQVHFMFLDVSQNGINFMNDFFTSFDRVEEGLVEVVRSSINKLHKIILSNSANYIIRILLGDMHVIVFHLSASEDRHG
jgi:hypothetical protein